MEWRDVLGDTWKFLFLKTLLDSGKLVSLNLGIYQPFSKGVMEIKANIM